MSLLEFLWVWTMLEVLLEGVLTAMVSGADGRDGSLVDDGFAGFGVGHSCSIDTLEYD